jgi:hypothetical protein
MRVADGVAAITFDWTVDPYASGGMTRAYMEPESEEEAPIPTVKESLIVQSGASPEGVAGALADIPTEVLIESRDKVGSLLAVAEHDGSGDAEYLRRKLDEILAELSAREEAAEVPLTSGEEAAARAKSIITSERPKRRVSRYTPQIREAKRGNHDSTDDAPGSASASARPTARRRRR